MERFDIGGGILLGIEFCLCLLSFLFVRGSLNSLCCCAGWISWAVVV